ncbi:MAG: Fic family protein [archaeon]|nr:Fic family protein [Nanoarchaeota archaeon]
MVYIYRKTIGNKDYYYLRASVRKGNRVIAKDIKFMGSEISAIKDNLNSIPKKYSEEIKKTYRTINRFLEVNLFLEKVKHLKLRLDDYLSKEALQNIEACKLHWHEKFLNLNPLTQEEALKQFVIEFAFNTTGIEGNTITLKQAQNLLLEQLTPKNKSLREIYDLQNTERVFNRLYQEKNKELTHDFITGIHDSLLENIDSRKGYRTEDVRVFKASFKASPPPYVKTDMDLLLKWYSENKETLHPFVLAVIFHHKFEKIHPFMDGNGRTGRMIMNHLLLKHDYPPLIIRKKNRTEYLDKLHKADECALTKNSPEHYNALLTLTADEMTNTYWMVFL